MFVVATANNIQGLPPELMRKGRFDEIFFVDLPNDNEREEIFKLHLSKRNRDPAAFDLTALASASEGYSGSDLEGVVRAALKRAFLDGEREPTTDDVRLAINSTVPLSTTFKEQIEGMRKWARTHARPASSPWEEVPVPSEDECRQRRSYLEVE